MADPNEQLRKQLARHLERVLVVDPNIVTSRLLHDLLRDIGAREVLTVPTAEQGLANCRNFSPQLIFTELSAPSVDGLQFTRDLRRSTIACRKAPVIVVTAEATAAAIVASRNAGVHEFLRKPFTTKDLMRRLEAVGLRQRDWIEAMSYIGPDRRRFNSGDYRGPRKRQTDAAPKSDAERIAQALKILKSAIAAIDTDPAQALRSMQAQAAELKQTALSGPGLELAAVVALLERRLSAAAKNGVISRTDIEAVTAGLWAFMPRETAPARPASAA
jgi:CheY-like chemotaxis protein